MTEGSARHRRVPAGGDGGRQQPIVLFLVALLTGACGAFAWITSVHSTSLPEPLPVAHAAPAPAAANAAVEIAVPARIDIADIGVSADVEALGLNGDGSLATPQDWNSAGWYAAGVSPGDPGPAVVVGHRDSEADGPAVFWRLGELVPGDVVTITQNDGNTSNFAVESVHQVSKADFPTGEVYGPSEHRLLKLITCTGGFDFSKRSYEDNLVVTARAV